VDPSGAVLRGVNIRLGRDGGSEKRSTTSDDEGRFGFSLLPPGTYQLQADKKDFESVKFSGLQVVVTETLRIEIHPQLSTHHEQTQVSSHPAMVQTDTSALGRVVNEKEVSDLPLVTRNFAQIAGLSPGVVVGVYNAGELGLGGTALSQIAKSNDGIYARGARSYDNNFQLDGISTSDVQGSSSGSGGIPIPNPDTIEEFKVQTGLYDAAFGRYADANVSVVTKTGSNEYHGTVFELLRNNILNNILFHWAARPCWENQFDSPGRSDQERETSLFWILSRDAPDQWGGRWPGQSCLHSDPDYAAFDQ
jgi:hypothetical protein